MTSTTRNWPRWMTLVTIRRAGMLFSLGLALRLVFGFCQGTQDMEWWKIWARESVQHGLTRIYGPTDAEVIQHWRNGASLREIHDASGKKVRSDGYAVHYSREVFPVVQPPVYLFALHAAASVYDLLRPGLPNTRWFNFAINTLTLLASFGIALVIYRFTLQAAGRESAIMAALLFWLNPLVLLNAPVQGYLDQLSALFVVLSIVSVAARNLVWSWVFLTVAVLTKPQAVLITPLVFLAGLQTSSWKSNVIAWMSAGMTAVVICSPWILTGRFLGLPVAVSQVAQYPDALTVESLNAWWPLNYAIGVRSSMAEGSTFLAAFFGPGLNKLVTRTHEELASWIGISLSTVGLIAFACSTLLILVLWSRELRARQPASTTFAAGMIVFGYFLFAKAVHTNHYFLMIPLFALSVGVETRLRPWFCLMVASFLFQDLLFYGVGRDYSTPRWQFSRFWLLWLTNVVSLLNLSLFVCGVAHLHRGLCGPNKSEPDDLRELVMATKTASRSP